MENHADHQTDPLTNAQLLGNQAYFPVAYINPKQPLLDAIKYKTDELSERRGEFRDVLEPIRASLARFEERLESVAAEFESRTTDDMLSLALLEGRVTGAAGKRQGMQSLIVDISMPRVGDEMEGVAQILDDVTRRIHVTYTTETIGGKKK